MRFFTAILMACWLLGLSYSAQAQDGNDFPLAIDEVWSDGTCSSTTIFFTFTIGTSFCLQANETAKAIVQFDPSGGLPFYWVEDFGPSGLGYTPGTYTLSIFYEYPYEAFYINGDLTLTVVKTDGTGGPNCSAEQEEYVFGAGWYGMYDNGCYTPGTPLTWDLEIEIMDLQASCPTGANGSVVLAFGSTSTILGQVEDMTSWSIEPDIGGVYVSNGIPGLNSYRWNHLPPGDYAITIYIEEGQEEFLPCGAEEVFEVTIPALAPTELDPVIFTSFGSCEELGTVEFGLANFGVTDTTWYDWEYWSLDPLPPTFGWYVYTDDTQPGSPEVLHIDGLPPGGYAFSAEGTPTFEDECLDEPTVSFSLAFEDLEAPVPMLEILNTQVNNCNIEAPLALDLCEGEILATTSDPLYYDTTGAYTVTWTYEDSAGNTSTQEQIIVVSIPCTVVGDCPSDVSGDGTISVADMLITLGEFGCLNMCSTDLDGDGVVSSSDLLVVLGDFGNTCDYE